MNDGQMLGIEHEDLFKKFPPGKPFIAPWSISQWHPNNMEIKIIPVLLIIFDYFDMEDLDKLSHVCKLFCNVATMDCLYQKFEVMVDTGSDISSSSSSNNDITYHFIDEEKVQFKNGKIRSERKTSIKIIEELDTLNPAINTRQPAKPRVSVIKGAVFQGIPEEESEWGDIQSEAEEEHAKSKNIQDILNEFREGAEIRTIEKRQNNRPSEFARLDSMSSKKIFKQ